MTEQKLNMHSRVIGIQFSILSPDEIRKKASVAEIIVSRYLH